jgi:phage shock protein A
LFSNIFKRGSRRVNEAADKVFTGSTSGIADAFDEARDAMVKDYRGLAEGVTELEMNTEFMRVQLERLNKEHETLTRKREGSLSAIEKATTPAERAPHEAAFGRFQTRIKEIEERRTILETDIQANAGKIQNYKTRLTKMQAEINGLAAKKAETIADRVMSENIIKLNERLSGLQTSYDRGPLEAVLAETERLKARAKVSESLAGTDVAAQDAQYEAGGVQASVDSELEAMLAARVAKRKEQTGKEVDKGQKEEEKGEEENPDL